MNWKFWERKEQTTGVAVTGFGNTVWSGKDYTSFARESYMMNVIAFRCIDYRARSAGSVDWHLYQKQNDGNEIVENYSLNNVLNRPNPEMSFNYLTYEVLSYLIMCGNAYLHKVTTITGDKYPRQLYTKRPDRMTIKTNDDGYIIKYVYKVGNKEWVYDVDPVTGESDILHLKSFNPLDDYYGMAITEPASREIDTSNSMMEWNKKLLDNMGRPGMMLIYDKQLTDKQFDRIKKDLREAREGAENAGKSIILEGGKDIKPYGFSPQEMDWINGNLELTRRICAAYGVPAQLMGIPDTSTHSNYREARASFWEDTVIPDLNTLKSEYNYWFFRENDILFLNYDLNNVPALQYKRDLMWERAQQSNFLTINEKRQMIGQDSIAGGDVVLVPATMLPLGTEIESDKDIDNQNKKAIENLMSQGMTEEEAQEAIGLG